MDSYVVNRYVQEPGTAWVQGLAHPRAGHLIYLASMPGVEVCAATIRRVGGGTIAPPAAAASLARFRLDLSQEYRALGITAPLLAAAMRLVEVHGLRAYDLVQLAAAVELNCPWLAAGMRSITLVSADQEFNTAAPAEGLLVKDPNLHR